MSSNNKTTFTFNKHLNITLNNKNSILVEYGPIKKAIITLNGPYVNNAIDNLSNLQINIKQSKFHKKYQHFTLNKLKKRKR